MILLPRGSGGRKKKLVLQKDGCCQRNEIPLTSKGKLALSNLVVSEFKINLYMVGHYSLRPAKSVHFDFF
jgi:hypothetical protein